MDVDAELEHEAAIQAEGNGVPPDILGEPEDEEGHEQEQEEIDMYNAPIPAVAPTRPGPSMPTGNMFGGASLGRPQVVTGAGIARANAARLLRMEAEYARQQQQQQQQQQQPSGGAGPSGLNGGNGSDDELLWGTENGDGADAGGTGGTFDDDSATDLTYAGFDAELLRSNGEAKPLIRPRSELWVPLTGNLGADELLPKRAMCINIIAPFFRRDAEFFWQWQLPKGHESRAQAAAALVSLLFAGTAMGIPSGRHEENDRQQAEDQGNAQQDTAAGHGGGAGGKAKSKPLARVTRYTYVPHGRDGDSYPQIQIGLEEIYSEDQSEVLALRVWLLVMDDMHSTSHLLKQVMGEARALHDSSRGSSQLSSLRSKTACAEQARHDRSGCGHADLRTNFERTAGMQWTGVKTIDDYMRMLEMHSGRTSYNAGRPCVSNLSQHMHCAAGRRAFEGDTRTGCGGRHPAAPEFLLNAKRDEALSFGLVGLDGIPLNVCDEQLDPSSYWEPSGHFKVPSTQLTSLWVYNSVEVKTPFDVHLTRPLQGTVLPGPSLMKLFVEEEMRAERKSNGLNEPTDDELAAKTRKIDQNEYNKLRSLMTRRDEFQRTQDALLRNALNSYDMLQSAVGPGGTGGLDVAYNDNPNAEEGEANYTLKTVPMTKRVAQETDRLWSKVVQPWISRTESELADMQARLATTERRAEVEQARDERDERAERREADEQRRWEQHVTAGGDEHNFVHMEDEGEGDGEDGDDAMGVDEEDEGAEAAREDETWEAYDGKMAAYKKRLYEIKTDVVKYHCRLIKSCFLSTKDAATLPAGYKARTCIRTSTHLTHSYPPAGRRLVPL